jgi:hypothetical protein
MPIVVNTGYSMIALDSDKLRLFEDKIGKLSSRVVN